MQRIQSFIYWACVSSEISHIFCCGLPMIFSIMSLMAGFGMIAMMPASLEFLHHTIHNYEVPIIIISMAILAVGWSLHYIGYLVDCRNTGCAHGSCQPKKKRSGTVLVIATALFLINVASFFLLHR